MPGAGTDKTKDWVEGPAPVVVLVSPQMGENIGAAARAMANFGLGRLRLVMPVQGWPNEKARVMAAGADRVLDNAQVFDSVEAAIADCRMVLATTARAHDQAKPVVGPAEAAALMGPRVAGGDNVAILFGPERSGLENSHVALADYIVTLPVNPAFASLNLAQAVLIVAYEWFKTSGGKLPFNTAEKSPPASKQQLAAFFAALEGELEKVEFFRPPQKRDTMRINLRNIFIRQQPSEQDVRTLHGVINAIAEGRKGPAQGGILDGAEAELLRTLLAEHGGGAEADEGSPVRGLARLLRRNPTPAERAFWKALVADRRFADCGFKRQVPVGKHIPDFVSFPLRMVVEMQQPDESGEGAKARGERSTWFSERGYRFVTLQAADVEKDVGKVLDELSSVITGPPPSGESR
ncbi:MAG: TrmJ/YjtD family RNA methyltransferase [Hyphomicrobiales bacterium]